MNMTQREWQQLEETVLGLTGAEKERLRALLNRSAHTEQRAPDRLLGLMADEPDLVDSVVESAMIARERDPLRIGGHAENAA
jgi:hypothetical protein